MTEAASKQDLIYLRFRDEPGLMPIAQDLDHLGELIEARVKPGLQELYQTADLDTVEYAGYSTLAEVRTLFLSAATAY